jgi:hypothetical protein
MNFQIGVDIPVVRPPTDGSNFGAQINAFIAFCLSQGCNAGKVWPGCFTAEVPISIPAGFDLIGLGQWDDLNNVSSGLSPLAWGGGVKILQPASGGTVISSIGTDSGNSISGMVQRVGIHNIAVAGRIGAGIGVSAQNVPLVDIQHVLRADLDIAFTGCFATGLHISNVWDTRIQRLHGLNGGYSDQTATASDPLLGRPATGPEIALGQSFGHPAVLIESPNLTAGCDVSNNIRIEDLHLESNLCNSVALMIRGNNAVMIRVKGQKIETIDGNRPLVVVDGAYDADFDIWAYGAATNKAPCQIGGTAAGVLYSSMKCPALLYFNACHGLHLNGAVGWNGQSPASLAAFVRATGCSGIYGDLRVRDGLARVTDAMLSVDSVTTDYSGLKLHIPPSVASVAGANNTMVKVG